MSEFKIQRSEFAKTLGISTDALKKRMKRGHLKNYYIFENGKYLFKNLDGYKGDGPI